MTSMKFFLITFLPSFLLLFALSAISHSASISHLKTRIVLLGTGTPVADPERSGPAVAIVVNNRPYLIDCGPGIVRQTAAAYERGVAGLRTDRLKRLFLTHLHSDHTAGLPDMILTPWVAGRDEPIEIYGPEGTRSMTRHILAAYEQDIQIRLKGLEQADKQGYQVNVHEITPGIIYKDSLVKVEALPVPHGAWPQAFAFKFYTPDRTIVISGDTTYSESMIEYSRGVDVLIHEVYSAKGFKKIKNPEFQAYHSANHTSSEELARIASEAKPKLLILYHQLWMSRSEDALLKEIRNVYSGKVVSGKDLDIF